MSYSGLGKTFETTLTTPFGNQKFGVTVPVEQWMQDGIALAKTEVMNQFEPEIPGLVGKVLDVALPTAGDYVTNKLWPSLQPKLRGEVDRAIGIAENKVNEIYSDAKKTVAIVAGALVLTMIGTSLLNSRRIKKAIAK